MTRSKKPKALQKKRKLSLRPRKMKPEPIVIDRQQGLIFNNDDELYDHFKSHIDSLEKEYESIPNNDNFSDEVIDQLDDHLDKTLDEPMEIWHDNKTFKDFPIFHFIRPIEELSATHVVVTYVSSDDEPTFVFFHFLTSEAKLVDHFRRVDLVYDRAFEEVGFGAIDGDSLSEGDPLSLGLFIAMLKVRTESDVPHDQFQQLGLEQREDTIENADEIWRSSDSNGNTMVNFIKECSDHETKGLHYVAVTLEDTTSQMHTLLFSFPTTDESLIDRYRQGENLQAEDVVQESSH